MTEREKAIDVLEHIPCGMNSIGREKHSRNKSNHFECSNCYMRFDQRYNYCPNCGADMRKED